MKFDNITITTFLIWDGLTAATRFHTNVIFEFVLHCYSFRKSVMYVLRFPPQNFEK